MFIFTLQVPFKENRSEYDIAQEQKNPGYGKARVQTVKIRECRINKVHPDNSENENAEYRTYRAYDRIPK